MSNYKEEKGPDGKAQTGSLFQKIEVEKEEGDEDDDKSKEEGIILLIIRKY